MSLFTPPSLSTYRDVIDSFRGRTIKSTSKNVTVYPWDLKDTSNVFWKPIDIKGDRWNKLFPYRLSVIDITKPNEIVGGQTLAKRTSKTTDERGITFITQHLDVSNVWEFEQHTLVAV